MRRELRGALRTLKKRVRAAETGAGDADALAENYYMLTAALSDALRLYKKNKKTDLGPAWENARGFARSGLPLTEEYLAAFYAARSPGLRELSALPVLLPAAFAAEAAAQYGVPAPEGESPFVRCVRVLFRLRETEYEALAPQICSAERALLAYEAFRRGDRETKEVCRAAAARLAREHGCAEPQAAKLLFEAENPAKLLQKRRRGGAVFLAAEALFPLPAGAALSYFALAGTAEVTRRAVFAALLCVLLYLPLLAAVRPLFSWLAEKLWPPYFLPSLDPETPEPDLPKTLITVSSLLPPADQAAAFAAHLRALRASDPGISAGVLALTDLKAAEVPSLASDAADIAALRREIERLNREQGGGFALAVRGRVYSATEKTYTGYERKRGAVETLVKLLTDGDNGFETLCGDTNVLKDVSYLLALDADTSLPFAALTGLLCVAAHPLNRAVLTPDGTGLRSGYGCFAPRAEVSLASAGATRFSRLMAWGGVSAYSPRVSARYMDLFGASSFSGKGLIDVAAYRALCVDSFPAGRVLSHDILEGGLLRTAFVSAVAVTESFPSSPAAYYRRQDRWARGDAQNLPFAFRRLREDVRGRRLPVLTALQLTDNAARWLTPVCCLAALLLSAAVPRPLQTVLFFLALLGRTAEPLCAALRLLLRQGPFGFSRVYFSACASAGARTLWRVLLTAAFLPQAAFVNARAFCRACVRLLLRRRTLEWTTAAEAERGSGFPLLALAPALCAAALLFSSPAHAAYAALLLLFIPFALSNGLRVPGEKKRVLSAGEREALSQYAAAAWNYFASYAGPRDRFLPPDNVQETPVRRVAHRTSPTNIGLYLVSLLAAADLSLIGAKELSDRLTACLESVFSLERWNGLLYNWYDTLTLQPLRPAFVSSVDCGNYLVCLTALKEGLREYAPLGFRFSVLIGLIETELANARLQTLYAPRRGLFSVGYAPAAGKLSDSYYDSYMSEARMTSYFASAKGLVPAAHWGRLDRSFLRRGRRTAAASYSGTAFEYFMPALFLPLYADTYASEGLKSALYEQRRRVRGTPYPYGVSESAYYAFDGGLNYRYRAHGLRALAMRSMPEDRPVFAPYACFLTLPLGARGAIANLRRFMALGAYGGCGFYEAVDFSPETPGEDYMVVRSYMAHHVGMSLISCVNALRDGLFVRRFMRDPAMEGAASLLEEKIPADAPVRRPPRRALPEKRPPSPRAARASQPGTAAAFSNGELSLLCSRTGENRLLYGGRSLLAYSPRAGGICAAVRTRERLLYPAGETSALRPTCFYAAADSAVLRAETALAVLDRYSSLAVPVKVKNRSGAPLSAELLWYFEPLLLPLFPAPAHPAFSDMGIRIEYSKTLAALVIRRVERGESPVWLAAGFADFSPFSFCCDRELLLGGMGRRKTPFDCFPAVLGQNTSFSFPAAGFGVTVLLPRDGVCEKVLLLCPAGDRAGALEKLARLRRSRVPDLRRTVGSPVPAECGPYMERFLNNTLFGAPDPDIAAAAAENTAPAEALWQQGISGDLPVLRVRTDGLTDGFLRAFLRLYRALAFCGVPADMVLLTGQAAEYGDGAVRRLRALVSEAGLSARLDRSGGVRVLAEENCSKAFLSVLPACPGLGFPFRQAETPRPAPPELLPVRPLFTGENTFVPNGCFIGGQPSRPWSHVLCSASFGTLLCTGSLGFTWALNSRLNPITTWHNDPCTPFPGETLLLVLENKTYDCVLGASVYFTDDGALYGAAAGNASLRVFVQVDAVAMKKRVRVEYDLPRGAALSYRLRPRLCENAMHAGTVRCSAANGVLTFENPSNTGFRGLARLYADAPAEAVWGNGVGTVRTELKAGKGTVCFYLLWAAKPEALEALAALPFLPPQPVRETLSHPLPEVSAFAGALLLHNAFDVRVLGRAGFYQNSGAYGFRDQLQDVMNTADVYSDAAKRHILRCAAAQFPAGDVLHWFHVVPQPRPHLLGVRTRCADDLLWLPLAATELMHVTGDFPFMDTPVPFLRGEPLSTGETERCGEWTSGERRRSLYNHCLRAVNRVLHLTGAHGLPLLRCGDWNDSFSEAGAADRGESVWLGMFTALVCERFAAVCTGCGDAETADALRVVAADMKNRVQAAAYNGEYYVRGFYDDGAPLGDASCDADRIDLLPQAFAVFAGIGTPEQRRRALLKAFEALWMPEANALRLFYPPFTETTRRAGYVNDYPPGVRENAGQYTHAAVWFYMALRREGLNEEAARLLPALVPSLRAGDGRFAVTADILTSPGREGRGGWSLYTGAAGWLRRALREDAGKKE